MEELLVKLQKEQADIMHAVFNAPPPDYAGFMRRWAEWYGLGKAIAFIEEGMRPNGEHDE